MDFSQVGQTSDISTGDPHCFAAADFPDFLKDGGMYTIINLVDEGGSNNDVQNRCIALIFGCHCLSHVSV